MARLRIGRRAPDGQLFLHFHERGAAREGRGGARRDASSKLGGARPGAGRKRLGPARLPHRKRPDHKARHPVHFTLKALPGLRSLRSAGLFGALRAAIARSQRDSFRITDFSVQNDHLHGMAESDDKRTLANGLRALEIRLTRAYGRVTGRMGRLWADRYHARELKHPSAVRYALRYIYQNYKHHVRPPYGLDEMSSAAWFGGWAPATKSFFDGWAIHQTGGAQPYVRAAGPAPGARRPRARDAPPRACAPLCPVVAPQTWLASVGWLERGGGPLEWFEQPAR